MYILNYGIDSELNRFRQMHSEIIENYQCIEYDMKRIYSAMSSDDYYECMDYLDGNNWGVVLNKLKKLDYSDNKPYFTEDEYKLLDEIRERRNYWCHQCYLDFVYIQNEYDRQNRLSKLIRQLENEKNRAIKLQKKMEGIFINDFCD